MLQFILFSASVQLSLATTDQGKINRLLENIYGKQEIATKQMKNVKINNFDSNFCELCDPNESENECEIREIPEDIKQMFILNENCLILKQNSELELFDENQVKVDSPGLETNNVEKIVFSNPVEKNEGAPILYCPKNGEYTYLTADLNVPELDEDENGFLLGPNKNIFIKKKESGPVEMIQNLYFDEEKQNIKIRLFVYDGSEEAILTKLDDNSFEIKFENDEGERVLVWNCNEVNEKFGHSPEEIVNIDVEQVYLESDGMMEVYNVDFN